MNSIQAKQIQTHYRTINVENQDIFYRQAGDANKPNIVLLHGFPTSSHMFRNLIPQLATDYHVIAPDYPGFGNSSMPSVDEFDYSFDNLASIVEKFLDKLEIKHYSLYVMDYGAPIGFRIASKNPQAVQSIIVQNGNAYDEGLAEFWDPIKEYWQDKSQENKDSLAKALLSIDATKWQYTNGARDESTISPDNWLIDQLKLDRPGNQEIQLELFHSYGSNPLLYPKWQDYFRTHQPPMLIVWGTGDYIFPESGAHPYKRDIKDLEFHLLDTGHFALEEDGDFIAQRMLSFLERKVKSNSELAVAI